MRLRKLQMPDLVWMGSLEECDMCHDIYPMVWIVFTGRQFLCMACDCEEVIPKSASGSKQPEEKNE